MVGGGADRGVGRWLVLAAIVVVAGILAWQATAGRTPAEPFAEASEVVAAPTREPTAEPTTEPPATEATTEPMPAPTTEPPALGVPARPAETPEEVRAVYSELNAAVTALLANPDPAAVSQLISPLCSCYEQYLEGVTALHQAGHSLRTSQPLVRDFEVVGPTAAPDGWELELLLSRPEQETYDSAGTIVGVTPAQPDVRLHVAIAVEGGLWKFTLVGALDAA